MEDNITEWGEIFHAYAEQTRITLWEKMWGDGNSFLIATAGDMQYAYADG